METLQRTANRGSISTGFDIDNSLKLEEDNSEYLQRATGGGNGDTQKHTISVWVKRTEITKTSFILGFANIGRLRFESDDKIEYQFRSGRKLETKRKFRDTSAWYHIVVVADSSLATSTDRMKLYINGVRETDLLTYIPQDQNQGSPAWGVYNTYNYRIGYSGNAGENFNGYIADAYYINGQTLDPTDFGEFDEDSGIWKPKAFTGTFGSLDNYLDFSNSSNLGEDANGGTDLSSNNITSADQATDTPTNNFAIISNAMRDNSELSYSTVSDGGTRFRTTSSQWVTSVSSIGVTKGKWYAEFNVIGSRPNNWFGIASMEQLNNNSGNSSTGSHLGESGKNWSIGYYQANGKLDEQQNSGYTTTSGWGGTVSQNQIVGVALDMDNHKLYMSVNNVYQNSGNPVTGANAITFDDTETVAIANTGYSLGSGNDTITGYNFGGYRTGGLPDNATDENGYGAFRYAPPSGYYALCTKNLAEYG
jgi:hypothetical protein